MKVYFARRVIVFWVLIFSFLSFPSCKQNSKNERKNRVTDAAAEKSGDWYPSKYGPDDVIGAANNLSKEKVLQAASLVKTGKTYSLAITTGPETPAFPPRSYDITIVQPGQSAGNTLGGKTKTTYNDDIIHAWLGMGTQIDGLGHVGIDNHYYNGMKTGDFAKINGLTKLGIENIPPIVTKGVLLDIAGFLGVSRMKEGQAINSVEIQGAAKKQGVTIEKGDVVILHTGWQSLLADKKDHAKFGSVEPGLGVDGAQYLAGKEVVAVGADQWGLEVVPFEEGKGIYEVHQILLAKNGIYILENIKTAELVKDKVYEFMFILGPPKFKGAAQAVSHPIAIR